MAFVIADRIKETSTTTGTGAMTLAGAMTGHRAFSAKLAVGDTCYYAIQAVDGGGAPTGEWECGVGTYSGANTLTRTTVTASSNADAAVSFSAGIKQVFITLPAAQVAWMRERLSANRTYYVRSDGSDSNSGLANTAGAAFLTVQKAVDVISGTLDLNSYDVTVQIADGTYTTPVTLKTWVGNSGSVIIQGNSVTPSNVIISTTEATCVEAYTPRADYTIKDCKLQTTTSGTCLQVAWGAAVRFSNLVFGTSQYAHIVCDFAGIVVSDGDYAISGGAGSHIVSRSGDCGVFGVTVTISGTPAFSTAYVHCLRLGTVDLLDNTYSGSATGPRYLVEQNSIIESGVTLPGSTDGSATTGGQYS